VGGGMDSVERAWNYMRITENGANVQTCLWSHFSRLRTGDPTPNTHLCPRLREGTVEAERGEGVACAPLWPDAAQGQKGHCL
jgi:hypothetical protein